MAQQNRTTLKGYFNTGDVPTEAQFADLIDSFHNPSNDGAAAISLADSGSRFTTDNVEAALEQLAAEIDVADASIATLTAEKITRDDVEIYRRVRTTDETDARTVSGVTLQPTDIVIWLDYSVKPVNMGIYDIWLGAPDYFVIAVSDETTPITTGTAKRTFRMPGAFTLVGIRASLTAADDALHTVDVNEGGVSVLSTKLTIDAGEKTSVTAATPAVISDSTLADDAEMTIDVDTAGTTATGLKVTLIGYWTS